MEVTSLFVSIWLWEIANDLTSLIAENQGSTGCTGYACYDRLTVGLR